MKQRNNDEIKRSKSVQDWFERNPSKTQFYLTLAVLITTIIFSYLSLKEVKNQYDIAKGQLRNANDQLVLARQQYDSGLKQRQYDLLADIKKQRALAMKETHDSIRISNEELRQQQNFASQNSINQKQLSINQQQLLAIQTQAKVANDQLELQKVQSANLFEQSRPIFNIDSVKVNKSQSSYRPVLSFMVSNNGIRTPHVDSTVTAVWNENYNCSNVEKHFTNVDLKDSYFITSLTVYNDCLSNSKTIYYLNVIYEDTYDGKLKSKHRFFRYVIKPNKALITMDVSDIETIEFIRYLKQNQKTLGRLL